ncbi:MAG TPA: GNAT family N-acetyltransferase [Gaiellaceae bacterium]|nr:GNAT family N-acetyltransferase [Gaiellaceae bacterium]
MTAAVEWIEERDALAALADEWEPLAERRRLPFMRLEWLLPWWDSFGGGSRLAVCVVRDGGELVAAVPLARTRNTLHALANAHTPRFSPLARDDEALRAAAAAVVAAAPAQLVLPLPQEDPAVAAFDAASRAAGRSVWLEPYLHSPYVERHPTWEAYRKSIGRNARKEAERRLRRVTEAGATISTYLQPGDLERELEEAFAVEASGWKGDRGTAIGDDAATREFYERIAHSFAARGSLLFSWVRDGATPVAVTINLLDFDRVWSLKFGMDERYRHFAPGIVSTYEDVRDLHEQGFEAYEMLGDAEPYKMRFTSTVVAHVILRSFRRRLGPLAVVTYRRVLRPRLKAAYNRVRTRR